VLDVALFAIELALGIAVPYFILRRDFARLLPEQLDRAWPPSSFWAALVAFGPICLPFHFVKTRRSLWGLVLGLGWMVLAFGVVMSVSIALDFVFGSS
jgi:hypothetical protein